MHDVAERHISVPMAVLAGSKVRYIYTSFYELLFLTFYVRVPLTPQQQLYTCSQHVPPSPIVFILQVQGEVFRPAIGPPSCRSSFAASGAPALCNLPPAHDGAQRSGHERSGVNAPANSIDDMTQQIHEQMESKSQPKDQPAKQKGERGEVKAV